MRICNSLLIISLALALGACSKAPTTTPATLTPVRIAAAVAGPAAPSIRTNGVLANKDEFRLAFKVGGIVKQITVREGELVRKGQPLAELEQAEVSAQVEQSRQAHEKARSEERRAGKE